MNYKIFYLNRDHDNYDDINSPMANSIEDVIHDAKLYLKDISNIKYIIFDKRFYFFNVKLLTEEEIKKIETISKFDPGWINLFEPEDSFYIVNCDLTKIIGRFNAPNDEYVFIDLEESESNK